MLLVRRGLAAILLLAAAPAAAQVSWAMPTEYPASSMPGEGVKKFADAVGVASGGRIRVTPSFDAAMGLKSADMISAVQNGRVPTADAFAGALGPVHSLFLLSSLPFLATTVDEARLLYDVAKPHYDRMLAGYGQKLLYVTPWPAAGIWAKKPVKASADLAGLKILSYDQTSTAVMKAAGALPVLSGPDDGVRRLRDGSAEAVLASGDGGAGRRLWELLPEFTAIGYSTPLSVATVSLPAWDALAPDLQAAVARAAAETEAHQWSLIRSRNEANYARMRSNGVEITAAIDPALKTDLAKAATAALDEWLTRAGTEGMAIVADFHAKAGKRN